MIKFIGLTKRNLLVFFKDIQTVIFSMLTSIIVFVLYLLFLKGTFVSGINSALDAMPGLRELVGEDAVFMYSHMTLLVGVVGTALITVPYNCLETIVSDRERKIDYDVSATPIRRWQIILSYFVAAAVSAIILTSVILTIGLLILSGTGDICMGADDILAAYGIVVLGSITSTALFMNIVLFFRTVSASGAFFGMLSAAAGFVIGAYIPLSQFSNSIQTLCNLFPVSQVTILLRNALLNGILGSMNESIGGVDQGRFVEAIRDAFTFRAQLFNRELGIMEMLIYVVCAAVLFMVTMTILYAKTYKRK